MRSYADTTTPINANVATTAACSPDSAPRHAAPGHDGIVTAISGNIITMQEETDEGGASYTVDATNATMTDSGAKVALTDIKVGDKIMVSGNNVVATSIAKGQMGRGDFHKGNRTEATTE